MQINQLSLEDTLPLTCSRSGTCCHGKFVLLNPWELFCIAEEKKITPREFRDLYTEFGGIKLRFDGKAGWKGQAACSQYVEGFGCSVHLGRPLACRLYPLGRKIQSSKIHYIYEGAKFPCLDGCPEVVELPNLSVGEYLQGQETEHYSKAQDEYLELMQNLADMAFELFLDTGLAESGDTKTLPLWGIMGSESPEVLANRIGNEWMDCLMIPELSEDYKDPIIFIQKHTELLQIMAHEKFGTLTTNQEFHEASVMIMGVALLLAQGIGADRKVLAEHWCATAQEFLNNK
ncbi:MAG: Fe-S-cluster containining protein [Gammaproteobacteria bacterium]|jgi:Fe-S-cluster containining protein